MSKLDDLDERMSRVEEGVVLVRLDVVSLKVRAGVWGAIAGMIPAMVGAAAVIIPSLTGG